MYLQFSSLTKPNAYENDESPSYNKHDSYAQDHHWFSHYHLSLGYLTEAAQACFVHCFPST